MVDSLFIFSFIIADYFAISFLISSATNLTTNHKRRIDFHSTFFLLSIKNQNHFLTAADDDWNSFFFVHSYGEIFQTKYYDFFLCRQFFIPLKNRLHFFARGLT